MPRPISAAALLAGLTAAGAVWAAPAEITARAPMDPDRIMGRWYEILRMPNKVQKNCHAAYQVWARKGDGYTVQQVCHRDSPDGKVAEVTAAARALNPQNTLFETSFLGGLVHQKYVLADHAPDYSWLISTTADGRFPKLLARSPSLPAAEEERLKQRLTQLGFDVSRMEACADTPAG
ncbi:MAG: lipocalin family protein [Caulobacteraceae bacterium]